MKAFHLLILLVFLPANLFCQQDDEMFLDSTISYRWDSETNDWVGTWRSLYKYDANGNITDEQTYKWDSESNGWVGLYHYVGSYNSNGNQTEESTYIWDPVTNHWVGKRKNIYKYNANGYLTEEVYFAWDSAINDWVGSDPRNVYTYDSNGNRTEKIKYIWDSETKDWIEDLHYVYSYDAYGNNTEKIKYIWDSETNDWIEDLHYVYSYDAYGNNTEWIQYIWDSETNDWIEYLRYVYSYNDNGKRTEEASYSWDSETNGWIGSYLRYVYAYDSNGNQIEKLEYIWDSEADGWVGFKRQVNTYNAQGNLTEEVGYGWDFEVNDWVNSWLHIYIYDTDGNLSDKHTFQWDSEANDWVSSVRSNLHINIYDDNGIKIEYALIRWDREINEWVGLHRWKHVYDSNGNLIEATGYIEGEWTGSFSTMEWGMVARTITTFDSDGDPIERLSYDWLEEQMIVSTYDANGNQIERSFYRWDPVTNERTIRSKSVSYWSNQIILDQAFYVDENCSGCTILGNLNTNSLYSRESITFNITSGNSDNMFSLDTVSGDILVLNSNELDYETTSTYNLTVEAQFEDSTGIIRETAKIKIYVNNLNDNVPVVDDTLFNIYENSNAETIIGTVVASDEDGDLNPLKYSMISGNENNSFMIDSFSGDIKINSSAALDYETKETYTVTIQVSDDSLIDDAVITINVKNINDNPPEIDDTILIVSENSESGTVVGPVIATDGDRDLNPLTYSIIEGVGKNPFAIESLSGNLWVNWYAELDYETQETHTIMIQVSDGTFTEEEYITIYVENINDNPPEIINATFGIPENSESGTVVGIVIATDEDGDLNPLTYSVISGNDNNAFIIDSASGNITVNTDAVLDYETQDTYTITIQVSDGTFTDEAFIIINLSDVVETSVIDDKSDNSINLFPNPAEDLITLQTSLTGQYSLEITAINGQILYRNNFNSRQHQLDLSSFKSGIYFITVWTKDFVTTEKIIKL